MILIRSSSPMKIQSPTDQSTDNNLISHLVHTSSSGDTTSSFTSYSSRATTVESTGESSTSNNTGQSVNAWLGDGMKRNWVSGRNGNKKPNSEGGMMMNKRESGSVEPDSMPVSTLIHAGYFKG